MANYSNIVIGIQARSTSHRFPRKVHQLIGDQAMLQHVIDTSRSACGYLNAHRHKNGMIVSVAVAVPFNDEICEKYRGKVPIVEGPEDDVLTRYHNLASKLSAEYIVRITADCPLIPHFVISKLITIAVKNQYDYCSNSDPRFRTYADGFDCEVISRRLLDYMHENAVSKSDREHVTPMAQHSPPQWAETGFVMGFVNLSGLKLSVDTPEDLENVRQTYNKLKELQTNSEKYFGATHVHRF